MKKREGVGKLLTECRDVVPDLSQSEMARRLHCEQSFISMVEADKRDAPDWFIEGYGRETGFPELVILNAGFSVADVRGIMNLRDKAEMAIQLAHQVQQILEMQEAIGIV